MKSTDIEIRIPNGIFTLEERKNFLIIHNALCQAYGLVKSGHRYGETFVQSHCRPEKETNNARKGHRNKR